MLNNLFTLMLVQPGGFPPPPPNENVPLDTNEWILMIAAVLLVTAFTVIRNRKKSIA